MAHSNSTSIIPVATNLSAIPKRVLAYCVGIFLTTATIAQTVQSVPFVELTQYAGKWYEVASYPQRFQKGCTQTTATYTATGKNYVWVENRCNKHSANGKNSYIKGKAFVVKNTGNAQLKVQFFWPFRGKYWIIELADDYRYAVVSHPSKKYLWILSRTPTLDTDTYQTIVSNLTAKGFDVSKLVNTKQE
jgi:apolipoprotein D and lipocalin family protein